MHYFFLNKKFWLPWCILLIIFLILEISIRLGAANFLVAPSTYLGKAVIRKEALENYGYEKVNVISLGDSRFDWGINHGSLKSAMKDLEAKEYIRFTFEQSGFIAIQTTVEWAIENLPNLQEVFIGFDGTKLRSNDIDKQMMISLPFSAYFDSNKYHYPGHHSSSLYELFVRNFKLNWYYNEIKAWLKNPVKTINKRDKYFELKHKDIWIREHKNTRDVCSYDLSSVKACYNHAQRLKFSGNKLTNFERFLVKTCTSRNATLLLSGDSKGYELSNKSYQSFMENWLKLFNKISRKNIKLNLFLLPEHHLTQKVITPLNSDQFIEELTEKTKQLKQARVIDLRNMFEEQKIDGCTVYSDLIHLNKAGSKLLTEEIIRYIEIEDDSESH